MCRVNKGVFSTPLSGLIGKKRRVCLVWRSEAGVGGGAETKTQLTEPACPEQKVKAASKHQN